jgi:DMSO reductase anchor subunit
MFSTSVWASINSIHVQLAIFVMTGVVAFYLLNRATPRLAVVATTLSFAGGGTLVTVLAYDANLRVKTLEAQHVRTADWQLQRTIAIAILRDWAFIITLFALCTAVICVTVMLWKRKDRLSLGVSLVLLGLLAFLLDHAVGLYNLYNRPDETNFSYLHYWTLPITLAFVGWGSVVLVEWYRERQKRLSGAWTRKQ